MYDSCEGVSGGDSIDTLSSGEELSLFTTGVSSSRRQSLSKTYLDLASLQSAMCGGGVELIQVEVKVVSYPGSSINEITKHPYYK